MGRTDFDSIALGGSPVTATPTELNKLAGVTAGTAAASKAAVLGANKNLDTLVIAQDGFKMGAGSGTAVTATPDELNAIADLSANGVLIKTLRIPITTTPTGAEQDTGVDLPAKAILIDVLVDVTTPEATGGTKTLDVGLKAGESGGDADGFIDGVSVAAAGLKRGGVVLNGGAYFDTTTRGLLLRHFVQGAGADDRGLYAEKPHLSDSVTAKSVVYTAGSNDFAEFRGAIILVYVEVA